MSDKTDQQVTDPTPSTEHMNTEPIRAEDHAPNANGDSNGVESSSSAKDVVAGGEQNEENNQSPEDLEQKPASAADNEAKKIEEGRDGSADQSGDNATVETPAAKSKARRKSGVAEHKNKKLSKKASKAKLTHTDAKPGDYFLARLKGYPPWPAIICDEAMLPMSLLKSRPVTAARADGTYRDDYKDGGAKVKDRTFPVMYLFTNEFGWIPNHDLVDVDLDTIGDVPASMRKDLLAAHKLAAEKHDLDYFKELLKNFEEQRLAELEAKEAAKAAKKSSKAKRKSKATADDEGDGDVDMPDIQAEPDSEGAEEDGKKPKTKKRKADEEVNTPQKTDSVKKPKTTIKLNTPKTTNGIATPKSSKDTTKPTKPKTKKSTAKAEEIVEVVAPKEPELTAEQKSEKKKKEILFLRHKLQRGLLTRDQEPKEEEMKQMSEFVTKLEGYADLEVSIIRATKINKVLKAILKLNQIPKEEEFQFKKRSQTLLDKWNKLLASDQDTPATVMNDDDKAKSENEKSTTANGVKGTPTSEAEEKIEDQADEKTQEKDTSLTDVGEKPTAEESAAKENPKEPAPESAAVESTA
ncbi:hypothetical protein F5884DRAFT_164774 [Xylogone sp. PMI_703]|nr:hypothetical protein F5884DRAFT_164774 [Xylogone sp. PMI_703]